MAPQIPPWSDCMHNLGGVRTVFPSPFLKRHHSTASLKSGLLGRTPVRLPSGHFRHAVRGSPEAAVAFEAPGAGRSEQNLHY